MWLSTRESRLSRVRFSPWEPALTGHIQPMRVSSHGSDSTRESRLSQVRSNPWEPALTGLRVTSNNLGNKLNIEYYMVHSRLLCFNLSWAQCKVGHWICLTGSCRGLNLGYWALRSPKKSFDSITGGLGGHPGQNLGHFLINCHNVNFLKTFLVFMY